MGTYFDWREDGRRASVEIPINKSLLRRDRERTHADTFRDPIVRATDSAVSRSLSDVNRRIWQASPGGTPSTTRDRVVSLVKFVQHIDYRHVQRGVMGVWETLNAGQGVCQDTSVLLAALLRAMDVETALLFYKSRAGRWEGGHMNVGVDAYVVEGEVMYEYQGDYYTVVETTSPVTIGREPKRHPHGAQILPVRPIPSLTSSWDAEIRNRRCTVEAWVANVGTKEAREVEVTVEVFRGVTSKVEERTQVLGRMGPRTKKRRKLRLQLPSFLPNAGFRVTVDAENAATDYTWSDPRLEP